MTPLNALTIRAAFDGYEAVLSINTNHVPTDQNIAELSAHLDDDTLVVGAALDRFHVFEQGEHTMDGKRVPSDAFMLLNLRIFTLYGFQSVSEAPWITCSRPEDIGTPQDPGMREAGIKEVPAFSLIQLLQPKGKAQVKLVQITGAERDATLVTGDIKTLDDHKRHSAIERAKKQVALANIPPGIVIHVI